MAFYYSGQAEHMGGPADQRRALAGISAWYNVKLRQITIERGGPETVLAEAGPILETVKRDPHATLDEFRVCVGRALADPTFDGFARALR